jgi:alpha-1,2-mannosyltransferase
VTQLSALSTDRARRVAVPVTVGCLALAALITALLAPGRRGWFDVSVYWGTAHWWRHGGSIYTYLHPGTGYGFTYPPFALLCMAPLSVLDFPAAVVLALLVNLACVAVLLHWLVDPLIRRQGWHRGYALVLACSLLAVFGPVRDTISFGQVNLVLLVLVWGDLRMLRRARQAAELGRLGAWPPAAAWAGIGIGLAAAVKLTPLLFIGYLLLTREWRAARMAIGTFLAATAAAALIMPADSVQYWVHTMWQTGRVGDLGYVSNQSLLGVYTRLGLGDGTRWLWLVGVLAVLIAWAVKVHRTGAADHRTGFALTGVAACLASPVTWVHHLVWVLPALVLLIDIALRRPERRWLLGVVLVGYLVFSIGLVWIAAPYTGLTRLIGANAGAWVCLALLAILPVPGEGDEAEPAGQARADRYAASP